MSKKNKKKIVKYVVGGAAVAAISAAVISAAVSCSSVNSSTTTSTNSQNNNTSNAVSTSISVTGVSKKVGSNYEAPYNSKITLSANSTNLPSGTVTYSWYSGSNNLLVKQSAKSTYEVTVGENVNTYYVVTYVNGVQVASSNKVTITPNFDASKFSGAIFANVNGSKSMQQVSTIDDTNGTQDYTLNYHVLYDNQLLDTIPPVVTWTINGQQSNDTAVSLTVSGLHMGVNTITAATTITIPGQSQTFTIKVATLTINVASLQISGNNVKNNSVNVNYDGSLTLSASKDSLASLTGAGISNATYQWYEITNNQSTGQAIEDATAPTLSLANLTNNATYYLVASWQNGQTTNTLTSNQIVVTVNGVQTINPTIVCDNNSITTPLNLGENNLNQTYKFTINQGNSTSVNGKVTYTLTNITNHTQVNLPNANSLALNASYAINFNNLNLIAGDKYQLSASITVPSANGQTTTYNATNNTGLIFDIYYNELSISASQASTVSEVANTNTYDVTVGSSLILNANTSKVYVTGTASYEWETSVNGTTWTKVNSSNDIVNGNTLTINNVGGNDAYYQLVETIGGITLTSNMIKVVPVASNMVSAQIYSTTTTADTLNIYSQNNTQQTLQLDLKNGTSTLSLSDLTNVSIDWYVNGKLESSNNALTFTNTYNVGQTNVTVKVSFALGNKEYSSVATAANSTANITTNTFTINYYNVDINATTNSINYGANADQDAITFGDDSYMYASPMYQWYVNGQAFGTASATKPTSLPNEVITTDTTFQLVVTNANNPSATAIKSNIIDIKVANDNLTASISNQYGANGAVTAYSNVTGSTALSFTLNLNQAGQAYKGSLVNSTITWELNGKSYNEPISGFGKPFTLPLDALMSGANTLKVTINLSGISAPIYATYTINYAQLTISQPSQIYYDQGGTLNASNTNFGNYIAHPNYFWEVNNEVSSTTNSSSYQINNLTTKTTYQLVVGNGSSITSSSIKIYSTPITITPTALSDLNYNIALNGATVNTSSTAHSLTTYTFSLSNLTDNLGMINATNSTGGKVTWTLSDSKGTVTKNTYNLSSESNWSDFAYNFTDYGTYTISATFSIDNYAATPLSKTESIAFNLTQTQADVSVSQNSSTLSATTTNSTTAIYDVKYNDGNVTLSANVANAPTSATYAYQWQSWDATTKSWNKISTNGTSQTYTASSKITSNVQYRVQITINNENKIDSTTIELAPQFDSSKFSATITASMPNKISWDSNTNTLNEYGQVQNKLTVSIDYDGDPISIPTTVTWTNSNITASSSNPLSATLKTVMGTNKICPTITLTLPGGNNKTVSVSVPTLTINDAQVVLSTSDSNIYYGQSAKISLTTASANSLAEAGLTSLTYAWYQAKSANGTSNGTVINSASSNTLTINDDKDNGYYYLVVSDVISSTNTITITSNSAIGITVGSLSNFNLTGNVTCANSDNTSETSPLQLTSANIGTYSFNYNVTSTVSGFNPNAISGTITYKLTNSKGNTITLNTDSENYGTSLSIDFSSLTNFVPGSYTLTVSGSLNDANKSTLNAPSATYSIDYSTVSITSSVGTVNGNTVMVPENDTKVILTANTDDVFTGNTSYTYQWYSVGSDGTLSAISDATLSTYDVPTTGVNAQEYEVKVTSGDVTITSSLLTLIPSLGSTKPTASIMTTSGATSLNIYKSTNATQTLDLNIYEDGKLLTTGDVTDLSVTWQVNGKTITADANSLTLTNYQFSIGVNTVSISNLSFKVGNTTYNPKVANFTVTYYALAIKAESTSNIAFTNNQATVNYSDPVGSIAVSANSANTYDTSATSYQWMVSLNGSTYQNVGSSITTFPTTLPAYNIDEQTSFELVANFAGGKTISNPISFTVNSSSKVFTAAITNSNHEASQTAYTTNDSSSTTVKLSLNLDQNGSAYTTYANLTGSTLVWQVKDGENGTWTDINGSATSPLSASKDTSYSYNATISAPGTYYYQAVITLNGISTPVTSSMFTFTYTYLSASISASSSTTGAVSMTSTGNYNAYYGSKVTVSCTPTGFSATDNPVYTWKVNGSTNTSITGSNSSFTINNFDYLSSQTYSLSISVDGQTLSDIASITINPAFHTSDFSTAISATNGGKTGSILTNKTTKTAVYEYDVTTNDLSLDVYYSGTLLTGLTPTVTWSSGVTTSNKIASYAVSMGKNTVSATAALVSINGQSYTLINSSTPTTFLTIYNAQLAITNSSSIAYDTATTISVTSASATSLSEVFGSTYTPTYTWMKNSSIMASESGSSITTDKLTSNTTYSLKLSYANNGTTINLTPATCTITVLALPTLTGAITCTNNSNNITSPLELTSSTLDGTYQFNLSLTNSDWTSGTTPTLTGTITYTLKTKSGTTIDLTNATVDYGTSFTIPFSTLADFTSGQYVLSATATINDANSKTVTTQAATYDINYNTASIDINKNPVSGDYPFNIESTSSITLTANTTDVFAQGTKTYQWKTFSNGQWTNVTTGGTGDTLTVKNITTPTQYKVVVTVGNLTVDSSSVELVPMVTNKPTATITDNGVASVFDIYKASNAAQTLTANVYENGKIISTNELTGLSVTWMINGVSQTNSSTNPLTFSHTYAPGTYTVSVKLSFKIGDTSYTLDSASQTYTINYYALNITPSATSDITFSSNEATVNYGTNVSSIKITENKSSSYVAGATSYEWYANGMAISSTSSSTMPTSLPNYHIDSTTTFTLVATINGKCVVSNAITFKVSPDSMKFTASITNSANKNSAIVYSSSTKTNLTLNLKQNNQPYDTYANLVNGTITWQYCINPNAAKPTWTAFTNEENLAANETGSYTYAVSFANSGTYTIEAVITLNGISTAITSSVFTVTYVALNATINVTSSTNNEVSSISTNNYKAYFTGNVNVALTASGFDLSNATYAWTVDGKTLMVNNANETNDSFMLPINFTSKQTYSVTISVDGQTLTRSFSITPAFNNSYFTTSITSATPTTGTILQNENGTIKEYNVTQNTLTYNVYYNGELLSSIDPSAPTPSITWTATNANSSTASSLTLVTQVALMLIMQPKWVLIILLLMLPSIYLG